MRPYTISPQFSENAGLLRTSAGPPHAAVALGISLGIWRSEPEELLAQRILVFRLRDLDVAAHLVLLEMCLFPLIDFGDGVIDGGERLFLSDRGNPGFHGVLVVGLQRVQFGIFAGHLVLRECLISAEAIYSAPK